MAIETKDLVLYKSERLTDTDDGGGKYFTGGCRQKANW